VAGIKLRFGRADFADIGPNMPSKDGFAQTILVSPPQSFLRRQSTTEVRRVNQPVSEFLEKRLGRLHARLRLGLEDDHEAQVFGQGINYFHLENLRASHLLIGACLKLCGLYWRGHRNAAKIVVTHNNLTSNRVPEAFDGFTILQLSDLHVDLSQDAMEKLTLLLQDISYDICVLTGDYRGQTFGPFDAALAGMARVRLRSRVQSTASWAITTPSE
jgi:hypothetical protein